MNLTLRHGRISDEAGPAVMGILNITADSFSDGGLHLDAGDAVARAYEMIDQGADLLDIGAESTRPGSAPVPPALQVERVVPIIRAVRSDHPDVPISIDTRSAEVASSALDAGADLVNDVSAMRDDPDMCALVATEAVPVVLMHMRGTPANMQAGGGPVYADVVDEVTTFLNERANTAVEAGVDPTAIVLDPGIGFGKRYEDNLRLMAALTELQALSYPVLVGASRKRFLGVALDRPDARDRLGGSLACAAAAFYAHASIVRVHDVRHTRDLLTVLDRIRQSAS